MCAVASRTSRPDLGEDTVTARHAHAVTVFDGGPPVGLSAPRTDHAEPCTWSARPFDVTAKRKQSRADHATLVLRSNRTPHAPQTRRQVWPMTKTRMAGAPQQKQVGRSNNLTKRTNTINAPNLFRH